MTWDSTPWARRIVRCAENTARGETDTRKAIIPAEFVDGGTVGPGRRGVEPTQGSKPPTNPWTASSEAIRPSRVLAIGVTHDWFREPHKVLVGLKAGLTVGQKYGGSPFGRSPLGGYNT